MTRKLLGLAMALLLLVPLALAQEAAPPPGAQTAKAGPVDLAFFVGPSSAEANETAKAGGNGTLWIAARGLSSGNNTTRHVVVNVTSSVLAFANASVELRAANGTNWTFASLPFGVPANATDAGFYNLTFAAYETVNGTAALLGSATGQGSVAIEGEAVAPAPAIPVAWYVGGGVAVLLVGALVGVSMRQRAIRRKMNEAPRRSQVMREMELERKLEKVEEKDPEQAQQIKAEIRQQEVVREKRRELQILEAKRADVLKTMDLLRKRHEAGGLSKLQYDNMLAKKKADLERIEQEIAAMEAEDASGGAAA